jgi:CBS domain-containing protein
MKTVAEILASKGGAIYSIAPTAMMYDAIVEMDAKNVGALMVISDGKLVGVISERDYLRKVALHGKTSKTLPVAEIMTRAVVHVKPSCMITEALGLMTEKRIRHLPVMDDGRLCGVVSVGDLVKGVIDDQNFTIHKLEYYITNENG